MAVASDAATDVFVTSASGGAAFHVDYVINNSTSMRTGSVMCVTDGTNVEMTDFATGKIGTEASEPEFSAVIDGTDIDIRITDGAGYTVTFLVRNIL